MFKKKWKNGNYEYLDSTCIVHKKKSLSTILDTLLGRNKITNNTEFETGRIIDGKKEYGKRIECGVAPLDGSYLEVPHGLINVTFTDYHGICGYNKSGWCEKIDRNSIVKMIMYGNNVRIFAESDSYHNEGYQCVVELHYIKN